MSEQTANLCTTDACESLSARLAKYEDAEGRPLRAVVLPEPMRRGDEGGSGEYGAAMIRGYNACLREMRRLNSSPVSACCDTCHGQGEIYSGETAHQGQFQPPEPIMITCPECSGESVQPVSAGGVDERAAFREHLRKCAAEVATWPQWKQEALGRPIAICLRGQFETWAMETDHPVFGYIDSDWLDHGDNPNTYANDYIQGAWVMFQRSAPSHGEQVREVVPEEWKTILSRVVDELDSLNCSMRDQIDSDMAEPDEEAELCDATDELIDEARALIATAPSAGSQEQG